MKQTRFSFQMTFTTVAAVVDESSWIDSKNG